ncbi:uncharacterized protein LOC117788600 [Drosophila innubila]|uniref:uncharacterized protein LOC117788600 n=1 Tax=Drosophila innubila TaxID=198719 RepID=UPI00148B59EA|nr:uncharacterized protein LOC117788600 [Drosophila innubila]
MENFIPMLITKSAYYNFLREFWLGEYHEDISPRQLLDGASAAWRKLRDSERIVFKEGPYIGARLAFDLFDDSSNHELTHRSLSAVRATKPAVASGRVQKKKPKKNVAKVTAARLRAMKSRVQNARTRGNKTTKSKRRPN